MPHGGITPARNWGVSGERREAARCATQDAFLRLRSGQAPALILRCTPYDMPAVIARVMPGWALETQNDSNRSLPYPKSVNQNQKIER
jgi:hypothetical protein